MTDYIKERLLSALEEIKGLYEWSSKCSSTKVNGASYVQEEITLEITYAPKTVPRLLYSERQLDVHVG